MRKSATIADVAKAAGVSRVAASAVINGARTSARVSPVTAERILAAARELRYIPNAAAQSLTKPGLNMFGVAFNRPEFTFSSNPYVVSVLDGIIEAATSADYNVTLFTKPWIDAAHSAVPYGNGRTDGLIIIAPYLDSDMVPELAAMGVPLVVIAAPSVVWQVPAVNVDNAQGGKLAAQHLLALGHRRIGFIAAGGEDIVFDARGRRQGFLSALTAAGITIPEEFIRQGNFNTWDGYAAARDLLSLPAPPTAIFAANDDSALGAIKAANDLGVLVPEQLSIIGFDDMADAATAVPPLTTIRNPTVALGRQAAELLIAHIGGETVVPTDYLHAPELIVRGSTAPPSTAK